MSDNAVNISWSEGLTPEQAMTPSEWADKYRRLSTVSSENSGNWNTGRTEYMREIMDCMSEQSPIKRIAFMKPAQVGGTEAINNLIGYAIHQAPGPILNVLPTLDLAKLVSKQRIKPMLESSEVLSTLVTPSRERDSGNTVLAKEFKGGILMLAGANSSASLRSMPVRYLLLDEVDEYPIDLEGQGSPIALAEARCKTFRKRKIFIVSTPTIAGSSAIEKEYYASDQRRYFVACPSCGHSHVMSFEGLKFLREDGHVTDAWMECPSCNAVIPESKKNRMVQLGKWVAERPFRETAGFQISAFYSPWQSWKEIAQQFLNANEELKNGNPEQMKTWTNTCLGEPFVERVTKDGADPAILKNRARSLDPIPKEVVFLTMGVDVQDKALYLSIMGFDERDTIYTLSYQVIEGEPSDAPIWDRIAQISDQKLIREDGAVLSIKAIGVDSGGHHTKAVYAWCDQQSMHRFAMKGRAGPCPAVERSGNKKLNLWLVGTRTIKDDLIGTRCMPLHEGRTWEFDIKLGNEYFNEICAESKIEKYVNGLLTHTWILNKTNNNRNEALDCAVYAYAAKEAYKPNYADEAKMISGTYVARAPRRGQRSKMSIW